MDLKSFFTSSAAFRPLLRIVSAALRVFCRARLASSIHKTAQNKYEKKERRQKASWQAPAIKKFFCLLKSIKINKAQNFHESQQARKERLGNFLCCDAVN
jgi:hypothetical protein